MAARVNWRVFADREALAGDLAQRVADILRQAIKASDRAAIAVSGGSTPSLFFERLSKEKLDWTKVIVTLVDERFVPPASDRSNERLVRTRLLENEARLARFVPLYTATQNVEDVARQAEAGIALLGRLDVVILGMGVDGHTASFFPGSPDLQMLTEPGQQRSVLATSDPQSGEPRLTLTLPVLLSARHLHLHIEGDEKRAVLEAALVRPVPLAKPISAVIEQANDPVQIFWAPQQDQTAR